MGVIVCENLSKWYGSVIAVNGLDVDIAPGITGLLGPNGSGKSSLLRMSVGLLRPSQGAIRVLDEDPWDNPQLLRRIGYLPDGPAPWSNLAGRDAALHAARLSRIPEAEAADAVDRALAEVGLTEDAHRPVATYSLGMRQRFKFALAILHDPELLILDEPLTGTDPPTRRDLIQLIRGLAGRGRSVLVSTHVLHDVEAMTERIILLNHGRLMASDDVHRIRDLLEQYPRTIRVSTADPRRLGAALWGMPSVLSLQAEEGGLIVRTDRPETFFGDLQELLLADDVPFGSIVTLDDNVEAVFQYLVG